MADKLNMYIEVVDKNGKVVISKMSTADFAKEVPSMHGNTATIQDKIKEYNTGNPNKQTAKMVVEVNGKRIGENFNLSETYLKMHLTEKLSKKKIEEFVEFVKKQLNFDITPYIKLEHSKRDYVNLDTHSMPEKEKRSLFGLERSYGGKFFKVGDNGGFGHVFHLIGDFSDSKYYESKESK